MSNLNIVKFQDLINDAFQNPTKEFFKVLENHIQVTKEKLSNK